MPSGSHGGSPGSHSSGGSSFGGGGSSWGRSSRFSRRSRPFRVRWHGRVYIISNGFGMFFPFAIFLLVFGLCMFAGISGEKSTIKKIETDYAYYQNMITIAEQNPSELIRTGTVTDCFKNERGDKWYIIYEIRSGFLILEGYSYSIYTMEEAQSLVNDTISIAVNTTSITLNTDSIPMDYKYTTLEDDGEYLYAKKSIKMFGGFAAGFLSVSVLLFGFGIRSTIKNAKPENEISSTSESTNSQPKEYSTSSQKASSIQPNTNWICAYCGSTNSAESKKCSQCRAKRGF